MKIALLFASICSAMLLSGCADNSLMSDEDYYRTHDAAAHSPDFSQHLPRPVNPATGRTY